ncbi:hypothetical protein [Aquimarina sp. Aq107]|uniref:hypothetical protein n=1 Tax=Aquimarina sp. Aq107 TaxID=1191912 RepID=UPI001F48A292|nr:hypothetical protein [Aquimarina sp. Aq107]
MIKLNYKHSPSDIGHQTDDIKHWASDTRHRTYKPKRLVCMLAIALIIASCSNTTFNTKEELWNYLNNPENKYIHTKTVNGVDFSIVYKPTDLLVDQELSGQVSAKKIDSLRSKYDQYLYFNLSMAKNNQELLSNVAGNKQQFGAMVNQLAFGMEQKIHFYTPQKDTIAMADYIYPRMYGMSGATTILLVYPKETMVTNAEHMTLSIEDLGFYTGEVKFKIPTKIFKDELKLKFE